VFQNPLLLQLTLEGLHANGVNALTHRHVPPNDGGIALGQILVGTSG
jgi:hydrogenase maturation protein HypF